MDIEILYLTYQGKRTVLCLDSYLVSSGQRKKLPCYILSPKQSLRRCYLNKEGGRVLLIRRSALNMVVSFRGYMTKHKWSQLVSCIYFIQCRSKDVLVVRVLVEARTKT